MAVTVGKCKKQRGIGGASVKISEKHKKIKKSNQILAGALDNFQGKCYINFSTRGN